MSRQLPLAAAADGERNVRVRARAQPSVFEPTKRRRWPSGRSATTTAENEKLDYYAVARRSRVVARLVSTSSGRRARKNCNRQIYFATFVRVVVVAAAAAALRRALFLSSSLLSKDEERKRASSPQKSRNAAHSAARERPSARTLRRRRREQRSSITSLRVAAASCERRPRASWWRRLATRGAYRLKIA